MSPQISVSPDSTIVVAWLQVTPGLCIFDTLEPKFTPPPPLAGFPVHGVDPLNMLVRPVFILWNLVMHMYTFFQRSSGEPDMHKTLFNKTQVSPSLPLTWVVVGNVETRGFTSTEPLRLVWDGEVAGLGILYLTPILATLSPPEWLCIKAGSCVSHFNVSLTVWAKSQDSIHKPQFLERKESRSGSNWGLCAY